jgi:outer membrane protein assembly factor BamA
VYPSGDKHADAAAIETGKLGNWETENTEPGMKGPEAFRSLFSVLCFPIFQFLSFISVTICLSSQLAAEEADDAGFGPSVVVERIEIAGNKSTSGALIENALPVRVGQSMRVGDPRLVEAKYRVLGLGYFKSVETRLGRGSRHGHVILYVDVEERGTITLEQLYIGTTEITPFWGGLDVTERNFFGTGVSIGAAFVATARTRVPAGEHQKAFELRLGKAALGDSRLGLEVATYFIDASEPYRVRGEYDDGGRENFDAFSIRRIGTRVTALWTLDPWQRVGLTGRFEHVETERPLLPTYTDPAGREGYIDLYLRPGRTRVASGAILYDRDTRSEPVLTTSGNRLRLRGEVGSELLGGSYEFGTILAKYEHWWPIFTERQAVSLHLTGGLVVGNAPRFDRLYVGDLNRLLTPRLMGLVVSTVPARHFGSNGAVETYGEIGAVVGGEYSYRLFAGKNFVYGGNLFAGFGFWSLASSDRSIIRDEPLAKALPIGMYADAGLRLDTEIGIFELSIANAIGRVAYQ